MSKYEPLWNWLRENGKEEYKLSYEEMREIMGFELDHSFLNYKKAAKEYGYEGNYVMGANIAGFIKVATAMMAHGIV